MILIVSHASDLSADLVIKHLRDDRAKYLRLDTDRLGAPDYHFGFRDEPYLRIGDRVVLASDVSAIWSRRFALPAVLSQFDPRYRDFAARELAGVMSAFVDANKAPQINRLIADRLAGNRLVQAARARSVGLRTPTTLVTQVSHEASEFAHSRPTVTKAVSFGRLTSADDFEELVVYTSNVSSDADFSRVVNCPTLLQERIAKVFDWRVTSVGSRLFAARARHTKDGSNVDWRRDPSTVRFESATLPKEVGDALVQLTVLSDIQFGAHDLVEDANGTFYFLETNPAGQWGWIELQLGLPIGRALADLLNGRPLGN